MRIKPFILFFTFFINFEFLTYMIFVVVCILSLYKKLHKGQIVKTLHFLALLLTETQGTRYTYIENFA